MAQIMSGIVLLCQLRAANSRGSIRRNQCQRPLATSDRQPTQLPATLLATTILFGNGIGGIRHPATPSLAIVS